jgi:hypothetical protein
MMAASATTAASLVGAAKALAAWASELASLPKKEAAARSKPPPEVASLLLGPGSGSAAAATPSLLRLHAPNAFATAAEALSALCSTAAAQPAALQHALNQVRVYF